MKNFFLFLVFIISFYSCSKQTPLAQKFNCSSSKIDELHEIYDFNKNFKLSLPTTWKTNLYYNKTESQIFAADTIKELTKSYILGTSFSFGTINFNEDYSKRIDSVLIANNLVKIDAGHHSFQTKKTDWYLVKGSKNGFVYHQFNLTVKLSENSYFNAYSEVYGDENIDERICESISIIENVKFLQ